MVKIVIVWPKKFYLHQGPQSLRSDTTSFGLFSNTSYGTRHLFKFIYPSINKLQKNPILNIQIIIY